MQIDRRQFVLLPVASLLPASAWAAPRLFFAERGLPIGIQFYALGPEGVADPEVIFGRLAAIGYRRVELQGLLGRSGIELRRALDRAGLECRSLHMTPQQILEQGVERLAAELAAIGATFAITTRPYLPSAIAQGPAKGLATIDWLRTAFAGMRVDDWRRAADFLNENGRRFSQAGIRIGYHNHNSELAPVGKSNGLELLVAGTDPRFVTFELDVGWLAVAGHDPERFLTRHRGRIDLLHVKNLAPGNAINLDLRLATIELGRGTLDIPSIVRTAYATGVREFYVEQEEPFTRPRLEAAKINYDYLTALPS